MRLNSALRYAAGAAALGGAALFGLGGMPAPAEGQASFVQNGEAGFVVEHIGFALSEDAGDTGACPNGMTSNAALFGLFGGQAPDQAQAGQSGEQQQAALRETFERMLADIDTNPCIHPENSGPDANFRIVEAPNIPAYGIDLDGQNSRANGQPAPGTCAHDDFRGFNGERGVDNQFFRVVGCSNSYQSVGQSNGFEEGIRVGEWGILITLKGLDDIRNDNDVEVGLFASADPAQLSPSRDLLPGATYAMTQDPRFRFAARGRIVNGVLTTDPIDVRFHQVTNSMFLERTLREARVRLTLSPEGVLEGYLSGYAPVEELYDVQYGFRDATDGAGEAAPMQLRVISSVGQAAVLGHTCNGAYYALHAAADGHRDPATGRCTSISTQYRIRAIPAFVVDTETSSVNQDLGPPAQSQRY